MKLPIDWSSAPEGATHYCMHPATTYKWLKDSPLSYYDEYLDKWVKYTDVIGAEHMSNSVEKPNKNWDGDGRPPIGTVCEYKKIEKYRTPWTKVKILYISENIVVMRLYSNGNEFSELMSKCAFSTIKTPEQIAAEERIEKIDEMIKVAKEFDTYSEVCEALYDAGYRKMEKQND